MSSNGDHCNFVKKYFKMTDMYEDVKVERLVEENIHYDPLFADIGITN